MRRRYAVIGDPVSHSLSPVIHRGWMEDHGIEAAYDAIRVAAPDLPEALASFGREGFGGLNVTLPHKEAALSLSASRGPGAALVGAANTLSFKTGAGWHADNTDLSGFETSLAHAGLADPAPLPKDDRPALVLGAGGASRAVAVALARQGRAAIFCNRSVPRAEALAALYRSLAGPEGACRATAVPLEGLGAAMKSCAFMVNATSLGHSGASVAWEKGEGRLAYDLSYGAAGAAFLAPARAAGWRTADGLGMLVAQAAGAFAIWFGTEPDFGKGLARAAASLAGKRS